MAKQKKLSLDEVDSSKAVAPIVVPANAVSCTMPFAFDTYTGCEARCLYCFARDRSNYGSKINKKEANFEEVRGHKDQAFSNFVRTAHLKATLDNPAHFFFTKRVPLSIGTMAEPFPSIEKSRRITYNVLSMLAERDYPTVVLTKRPDVLLSYADRLKEYKNLGVQVSIAFSDKHAAKVDINSPLPSERFQAIRELTKMGFPVIIRLSPAIIPTIYEDLTWIVDEAKKSGCWAIATRILFSTSTLTGRFDLYNALGLDHKKVGFGQFTDLDLVKKFVQRACLLTHSRGMKYFSTEAYFPDVNRISDGDECCGTEKLHGYTKYTYNIKTKMWYNVPWNNLENGLEQAIISSKCAYHVYWKPGTQPYTLKTALQRRMLHGIVK